MAIKDREAISAARVNCNYFVDNALPMNSSFYKSIRWVAIVMAVACIIAGLISPYLPMIDARSMDITVSRKGDDKGRECVMISITHLHRYRRSRRSSVDHEEVFVDYFPVGSLDVVVRDTTCFVNDHRDDSCCKPLADIRLITKEMNDEYVAICSRLRSAGIDVKTFDGTKEVTVSLSEPNR